MGRGYIHILGTWHMDPGSHYIYSKKICIKIDLNTIYSFLHLEMFEENKGLL